MIADTSSQCNIPTSHGFLDIYWHDCRMRKEHSLKNEGQFFSENVDTSLMLLLLCHIQNVDKQWAYPQQGQVGHWPYQVLVMPTYNIAFLRIF